MKKLTPLREGLDVMVQCFLRQHFADCYWLHELQGGHASWREPTMRKFASESTTYFVTELYADRIFRRCDLCSENNEFLH